MRKADYAALAQTIASERERIARTWFDSEDERLRHLATLRLVAQGFVQRAHVDRVAFLTACGIVP